MESTTTFEPLSTVLFLVSMLILLYHIYSNKDSNDIKITTLYYKNNVSEIVRIMKRLGYYNINITERRNEFIDDCLACVLFNVNLDIIQLNDDENSIQSIFSKVNNIKEYTINQINDMIKQSSEYKQFNDKLNNSVSRAVKLSKFLGSNDTVQFYKSLTNDELVKLCSYN
jgi:hypothetical protein